MTDIGTHRAPTAALLRSWHSTSVQSVWRRPGDWYTPAAEALAEALEARLDTAPAAYRLGQARSSAGVGITEAIDDMAVLFKAAGFASAPIRSVRALCEGWTEGATVVAAQPPVVDAESGLGTVDYLKQRLAEVYGTAQRRGERVPATHALVMVDVSVDSADPWQRMARNATIGEALRTAYGDGHPIARLGDGLYGVLIVRDESLGESLAMLRDHIVLRSASAQVGNLTRQPARLWVEPLPETHAYASQLVDSLQR
ncbi:MULTISPECIES: hypothetical protein [Demequina]|uniref:GGDEF domain-containing protein n=1 Tax=Demequina litorisediminis TaxID=1849022 RepID=A0ABQ6IFG6_9MICO|nr:hypothetical protein [Demequina litorisediminis]GMA36030.1 hypothetical protein GCM10025876_22340 [Demequina litorisediminis]